ncbi:MAG: shikimate kinase [Desulfovibrio sp.]|jgi:shikimate kinase|nr:shikimate kinase [Desulfovibrio sp.]
MSPAIAQPARLAPCIVLIGMAAAGKSTVGESLSRTLDWAFMDSDHLIESCYGTSLEDISRTLGKEAFLDVECLVIRSIQAHRCVIATGGSVVYRDEGMHHLASLGPLVYLDVAFSVIQRRIVAKPQRGLAIAPGQSIRDLYAEREPRYRAWANVRLTVGDMPPQACADAILAMLDPATLAEG